MEYIDTIKTGIAALTDRLRDKHGVVPRFGFEWEFQLLDADGNAVHEDLIQSKLKTALDGHPAFEKIYKERAHGLWEITTKPLEPLESADGLVHLQTRVADVAKQEGWHLSAHPVVSKTGGDIRGSAALQLNSSLTSAAAHNTDSVLWIGEHEIPGTRRFAAVNAKAANATHGIMEITAQTPMWSFSSNNDIVRLNSGDGTPKHFSAQEGKEGIGAINIRTHTILMHEEAAKIAPEGLDWANRAHLEERMSGARMDPYVAAFRTNLGITHGLDNPMHADGLVPIKSIYIDGAFDGRIYPEGANAQNAWKALQESHLPKGSILHNYIENGTLASGTLEALEHRAAHTHIMPHESAQFRWSFEGNQRSIPAHEAERAIEESMHEAAEKAKLPAAAPKPPNTVHIDMGDAPNARFVEGVQPTTLRINGQAVSPTNNSFALKIMQERASAEAIAAPKASKAASPSLKASWIERSFIQEGKLRGGRVAMAMAAATGLITVLGYFATHQQKEKTPSGGKTL